MWPPPQNNYLKQQWCLHVRSSVRTHVRTYVRTHVCTYTPHARSYRVSVVQSGQFKICIGGFRSCKNSASWGSRHFFCTTKRTAERPKGTTERQNVRPRDRNMYDRTDMWMCGRTTERVTCNRLKTHIEYFLFGKNVLWAVNFKFLVGHSMKKPTLTTTVRSECRLSHRTSLHKSMCLAPQTLWSVLTSTQINPD